MHIALEGIDGVGKTTFATLVAEELGFTFVEKPLHYLFDEVGNENYIRIRDKVNASSNRVFTSWFYGLSNIYLYEKFKNQDIVTDRHLLSNYSWSGEHESESVFSLLVEKIGMPEFTFIIYANKETILKRIVGRDKLDPDINKVEYISKVYRKMEEFCIKHSMPYQIIDTSNKTKYEVKDIIVHKIKSLRSKND
jgi:thymidylate kinase